MEEKIYRPLVTDDPQDNMSAALNLFYVKDGWTWVRGGGPGPEYEDISLNDYVRMIAKEHDLEMAKDESDEEISTEMAELLFDGTGTMEGIVATLYAAGWAFAELRERLKHFEALITQGLLLEPEEIMALIPPPNVPLTLEELREMDGEPVWIYNHYNRWCDCRVIDHTDAGSIFFTDGTARGMWAYGDGWLAYRSKPEEVTA